MNRDERQLYSRQVLLPEIGPAGQRALCAATFVAPPTPAGATAEDYLKRAGCTPGSGATLHVPHVDTTQVTAPAADALAGALAATRFIAATVGFEWGAEAPIELG